jgi:hypothetical protein
MKLYRFLSSLLLVIALATLAACSSSSSNTDGSQSQNTSDSPASNTGRVSLLITDNPRTDFDQILVTLESVRFLSDDGNGGENEQIVFNEPKVINLLALQTYSDLLVTTELPAGTYNKIRLYVSQVELRKLDSNGNVVESHLADLPANGKIDLNPQGTFDVVSNGYLVVELDMDANKSFQVVEAGKSGKYKFRPLVLVNVLGEQEIKLVLLDGKVFDKTDTGLVLCGDTSLTEVNASCLDVGLNANTVVQDDLINTIPSSDLVNGDIVEVLGKMAGNLSALHIVKNNDSASERDLFSGLATSTVSGGMFGMDTNDANPSVPAMTSLDVTLADGARIFDKYGNVVPANDVSVGGGVTVYGLAIPDIASITDVTAAFALYNEIDAQDHITGSILTSDTVLQQLQVNGTLEGGVSSADYCVSTSGADIYLLTSTPDGISSVNVNQDVLTSGQQVDVYANGLDGNSCYQSDIILVTD